MGSLWRPPAPKRDDCRLLIELPDTVKWARNDKMVGLAALHPSPYVFHLFHGLGGSSQSRSMIEARHALHNELKHSVIRWNHRGQGEGAGLARGIYFSGAIHDAAAAIRFGRERWPDRKHIAVGFSLSGNLVLQVLSRTSELPTEGIPDAAIVVNPSIHPLNSALQLKRGINRIYDQAFVSEFRKSVALRHQMEGMEPAPAIPRGISVYDFDELYSAPAAGFPSRDAMYTYAQSRDRLHLIERPTLIVTSQDDPFIPFEDFEKAHPSAAIQMVATTHGGHLGFLDRDPSTGRLRRWLDTSWNSLVQLVTTNPFC
jgi:predicted alpha/beta-fold hydrolase